MNGLIRQLLNASILPLTLFTLGIPALADQIWQGTGRIIDGAGEGSSLGLKINADQNRVTFLSGPSQNEQITLQQANPLAGKAKTKAGVWQFLQADGQKLVVLLSQNSPYRIIRYILAH